MSMTIKVNGSEISIEFETILAKAKPQTLAEWGWKLAEAERELAQADASYRGWRARQGKALVDGAKKSAPSEWKVKQSIDSMPDFLTYKNGLADAHYNVRLLLAVIDAVKAEIASTYASDLYAARNAD